MCDRCGKEHDITYSIAIKRPDPRNNKHICKTCGTELLQKIKIKRKVNIKFHKEYHKELKVDGSCPFCEDIIHNRTMGDAIEDLAHTGG